MSENEVPVIAILGRAAGGILEPLEVAPISEDQSIVMLSAGRGIVIVLGDLRDEDVSVLERYGVDILGDCASP